MNDMGIETEDHTELVNRYDADNDGKLNFLEFCKALNSVPSRPGEY
jgi:Ca2+-binding EF-hand superfamily protein